MPRRYYIPRAQQEAAGCHAPSQSASTPDSDLQERCTRAEAKVAELQKDIEVPKEITEGQASVLDAQERAKQEQKEATSAPVALEPFCSLHSVRSIVG